MWEETVPDFNSSIPQFSNPIAIAPKTECNRQFCKALSHQSKKKSPAQQAGDFLVKASLAYLEQEQLAQQQSLHIGQQGELVHCVFSVFALATFAAYTEAPASTMAAVTPMINFFIVF